MRSIRSWIVGLLFVGVLATLGVMVAKRLPGPAVEGKKSDAPRAVPVELAPIEHVTIEHRRMFSGTLEATARVTIAPKVAGRIVSLPVDISDPIERGQVVAKLDADEFAQAVAQARAELAVAQASLAEAQSAEEIAQRELDRTTTLHDRGIASDSQLDTVRAASLSKSAAVKVASAEVTRAESAVETAQIRLGYTTIRADWEGGNDHRVVAERLAEEGDTVSANTPLLSIVGLDPIEAVIYSTERDYALLVPGHRVTLRVDAFPDRRWEGEISRVAPVFREGSRQARVEILVENTDAALKPGMFVRVEAVLGRTENATIVPAGAIARRDDRDVVFVVRDGETTALLVPVEVGLSDGGRVAVRADDLSGSVVTLGQQLLSDGSKVTVPERGSSPRPETPQVPAGDG